MTSPAQRPTGKEHWHAHAPGGADIVLLHVLTGTPAARRCAATDSAYGAAPTTTTGSPVRPVNARS